MEMLFLIYMGIGVVVAVIYIFNSSKGREDIDLADKLLMVVFSGMIYAAIWPYCALALLKDSKDE